MDPLVEAPDAEAYVEGAQSVDSIGPEQHRAMLKHSTLGDVVAETSFH